MKQATKLKKVLANAVKPIPRMTVKEWANTYLKLPSTSAEPGKFKSSRTPYLEEVMECFTDNNVSKIVVKSASQVGKALAIDTPIPTPDGFKTMLEMQIGDKVFDERGEVCNVIGVSEIFYNHDCYKLTFSDGAEIVADAEHLWKVQDHLFSKNIERTLTTEEIVANYKHHCKNKILNRYAIPVAKPLNLPEKKLPIDAYTLGYWIGDGSKSCAKLTLAEGDDEIVEKIKSAGYGVTIKKGAGKYFLVYVVKDKRCLYRELRLAGLLNNKHIPEIYLRASYEQRLELLKGILDADGSISKEGVCHFTQFSEYLTEEVAELIKSLGFKVSVKHCRRGEFTIHFTAYDDTPVFGLKRKYLKQIKAENGRPSITFRRRITNVEKVASVPTKCIAVDSPSHLYLAGKNFIPTHNTQLMLAIVGRQVHLDPANIMIVEPTLDLARDFSKDRLQRMIDDCQILTPLFLDNGKSRNANQTILSKFFIGGRIVLQGANSPAGLASRPIRILLCDEVDRFPESASDEGDPISLAEKRQTTFFNYKTGIFSTPTVEGVSHIDKEYNLGTCEQWQHQCPNCKEFHFLDYRDMQVDFSEKVDEYQNKTIVVNSVNWRCPNCGFEFSELTMKSAPQKYIAQNPDALKNGVRSFWINGFSSTFLSWKTIMKEYLEAKGDPVRESVVFNTRFGMSYKLTGEFSDENAFLNRREEITSELTEGVLLLTAGVDVQANRLEVSVFGWGFNEQCFGICHEIIRGSPNEAATFMALDSFLDREFHFSNGDKLKIARTFIDSGFATKNIYEYCRTRQQRGIFPIKGNGGVGVPLIYRYSHIRDKNIILTILGVNDGKSQIFSRLAIDKPENAGYIHFYKDNEKFRRGFDRNYFQQLIAEKRVVRKSGGLLQIVFEPIQAKVRNEALDCFTYSLAAKVSCVGNMDSDKFFAALADSKTEKPAIKKTPAKKIQCRSIDIFNN